MSPFVDHAHILLVDDDDMIRLMAAESLRHAGLTVTDVDSGEAALQLFEENHFDLVLLDVMMPGIDGYTVCQGIRQHPRGNWLPILMLTGLNDNESIERAYDAGATDFITKPINWLLLTQRVRYGLRTSRAVREVARSQRSLAQAQRLARMGSWEWSITDARLSFSEELRHIFFDTDFKLSGAATPEALLMLVRADDRSAVRDARMALLESGQEYQLAYGIERANGELREVFEQAVAVRDAGGAIVRVEGISQDITERVEAQRRIEHLALHDGLTGLANRQFFGQLAEVELERARREHSHCAILTIDIDHFKSVNDALGDAAGDQLLCTIAARLLASVRSEDLLALHPPFRVAEMVARIDGDAFTTLVLDVQVPEQAALVAQRLQKAVAQPVTIDGHELVMTASVGIAFFPRDAESIEALTRHAEQALYAAKAIGPASYCFFNEEMNAAARYRLQSESELRQAIAGDELLLHFQPKVDVASGCLIGAEALVRWQH
ncbi:MAG: diguanylate cyclase, partial [Propionivibrio sp.]